MLNMITFQSRNKAIQTAGIIERKAHNVYPHISTSRLDRQCGNLFNASKNYQKIGRRLIDKAEPRLQKIRTILNESKSPIVDFVFALQDFKVGNCFEETFLAMIIGVLNGQKNIYLGSISVNKQNVETKKQIDHAIAFITNKNVKKGKEYNFKNKEAVIIDPWLGITDFADKYFTQVKYYYKNFFDNLPNQDFLEYIIGTDSKDIKEFRRRRKKSCQDLKFNIEPSCKIRLDKPTIRLYKGYFPELVIKNYKKIKLPRITKPKSIAKNDSL